MQTHFVSQLLTNEQVTRRNLRHGLMHITWDITHCRLTLSELSALPASHIIGKNAFHDTSPLTLEPLRKFEVHWRELGGAVSRFGDERFRPSHPPHPLFVRCGRCARPCDFRCPYFPTTCCRVLCITLCITFLESRRRFGTSHSGVELVRVATECVWDILNGSPFFFFFFTVGALRLIPTKCKGFFKESLTPKEGQHLLRPFSYYLLYCHTCPISR